MSYKASISWVIIGKDEYPVLNRTIPKLTESALTFEIIYVDSGSTDQTLDFLKKYPSVKIVNLQPPFNAAKARSTGVMQASGNYIGFIDGDFIPDLAFIDKHLREGYDVFTGQKVELTPKNKIKLRSPGFNIQNPSFLGGNFIISYDAYNKIEGWSSDLEAEEERDLLHQLYEKKISVFYSGEYFGVHDNRHKKSRTAKVKYFGGRMFFACSRFTNNLLQWDKRAFLSFYFSFLPALSFFLLAISVNVFLFFFFLATVYNFIYFSVMKQRGLFLFPVFYLWFLVRLCHEKCFTNRAR